MVDLTEIFVALISVISSVVTVFLIPWLRTKLTKEQLEKVQMAVDIGAYAAEKAFGAGNGEKKFAYLEEYLAKLNIKVDTATLRVMAQAAVKKLELADPAKTLTAEVPLQEEEDPEEEDETAENMEVVNDGA